MERGNSKLIEYFISETNKKFDELKDDLREIKMSVDDLHAFKTEIKAEARANAKWISVGVGALCIALDALLKHYGIT